MMKSYSWLAGLLSVALIMGGAGSTAQAESLYDCAPNSSETALYNSPDTDDAHPDFGSGGLPLSWSLIEGKLVEKNGKTFFQGDLYTPQGQLAASNAFGLQSEWSCTASSENKESLVSDEDALMLAEYKEILPGEVHQFLENIQPCRFNISLSAECEAYKQTEKTLLQKYKNNTQIMQAFEDLGSDW